MELAGYVRSPATATKEGQIFEHYFNPVDRKMVDNVYDAILGGDPSHLPGNPLLADITVVPDFTDNRYPNLACKRGVMAALRYQDTDKPKMIICPRAGFGHGGIGKGYNNVVAISCPYTRRKRLAMRIAFPGLRTKYCGRSFVTQTTWLRRLATKKMKIVTTRAAQRDRDRFLGTTVSVREGPLSSWFHVRALMRFPSRSFLVAISLFNFTAIQIVTMQDRP
ncbi:unnamed protein product [Zymoseptoria tritici ST99CH_3D1]|nr:unnamed protein product [Zymoseptoria tritici ST99CH_3D1]